MATRNAGGQVTKVVRYSNPSAPAGNSPLPIPLGEDVRGMTIRVDFEQANIRIDELEVWGQR